MPPRRPPLFLPPPFPGMNNNCRPSVSMHGTNEARRRVPVESRQVACIKNVRYVETRKPERRMCKEKTVSDHACYARRTRFQIRFITPLSAVVELQS